MSERAFLRGAPLNYTGFDGAPYQAVYLNGERNGLGVGTLEIRNGVGEVVRGILCAEHKALTFFANVARPSGTEG